MMGPGQQNNRVTASVSLPRLDFPHLNPTYTKLRKVNEISASRDKRKHGKLKSMFANYMLQIGGERKCLQ
jgi:hypothetical protein